MNVEVFNLMSLVNKTRFLVQDESCESKSELNCNSKVYVIQNKNGIMVSASVNVKN